MAHKDGLQEQLEKKRRKVDVDHFDLTLREIARMAADNELVRAPAYQRKFRWDENAESRLIESLFLGLPVPSIFVAANKDGSWEVVDGLQRISTIIHFLSSADDTRALKSIGKSEPLRLSNSLSELTKFQDKTFSELPVPMQLAFAKRYIRVTALSDKSDRRVRYELFERLNNGGVALTPQEVRACVYRGSFAKLIGKLTKNNDYQGLLKLQKKRQNDGTREELVLKFFAYLNGREKFDGNVQEFLNDFMEKQSNKDDFTPQQDLFNNVVKSIARIHAGPVLREGYHSTPLNQFEAILVAAGELITEGKDLKKPKNGWLNDAQLVSASTKGTNTPAMLRTRIERAKELLEGKQPQR